MSPNTICATPHDCICFNKPSNRGLFLYEKTPLKRGVGREYGVYSLKKEKRIRGVNDSASRYNASASTVTALTRARADRQIVWAYILSRPYKRNLGCYIGTPAHTRPLYPGNHAMGERYTNCPHTGRVPPLNVWIPCYYLNFLKNVKYIFQIFVISAYIPIFYQPSGYKNPYIHRCHFLFWTYFVFKNRNFPRNTSFFFFFVFPISIG